MFCPLGPLGWRSCLPDTLGQGPTSAVWGLGPSALGGSGHDVLGTAHAVALLGWRHVPGLSYSGTAYRQLQSGVVEVVHRLSSVGPSVLVLCQDPEASAGVPRGMGEVATSQALLAWQKLHQGLPWPSRHGRAMMGGTPGGGPALRLSVPGARALWACDATSHSEALLVSGVILPSLWTIGLGWWELTANTHTWSLPQFLAQGP